jgi:glutamyl/glutaminyl-tRNA synthetase
MSKNRGNFGTVGTNSPFRNRPAEESLQIFRDMKAGKYKDGEHILRAKMSEDAMSSPIMTNRDPALYRIRHAHHHRTGDDWCIYPMYDYTHPISDALEEHHALAVHAGIPGPPPVLRLAGRDPGRRRLLPRRCRASTNSRA